MANKAPLPSANRAAPASTGAPSALVRAHAQNEAVQGVIEESATELELINTVLQQELPDHVQSNDVALALEKSAELETKMQDTVNELVEVNQTLHQEIAEREALEKELAHTKAALHNAQQDTQNS